MKTEKNTAGSATGLTKDEWIARAAAHVQPYLGDGSRDYAESLYETYVEEDDPDCTPEDAVDEDMSYWDGDE